MSARRNHRTVRVLGLSLGLSVRVCVHACVRDVVPLIVACVLCSRCLVAELAKINLSDVRAFFDAWRANDWKLAHDYATATQVERVCLVYADTRQPTTGIRKYLQAHVVDDLEQEKHSNISVLVLLGDDAVPVIGPFAFRFGVFTHHRIKDDVDPLDRST